MLKIKYYVCWVLCVASGIIGLYLLFAKNKDGWGLFGLPATFEMWFAFGLGVAFAVSAIVIRYQARCPSCGLEWGLIVSDRVFAGATTEKGFDGKYHQVSVENVTYTCVGCGHSVRRIEKRNNS